MCKKINLNDLIGKIFNKLKILRAVYKKQNNGRNRIIYQCKCACGTIKEYRFDALQNNTIKSCGCIQLQKRIYNQRLYRIYYHIKSKCYNKNDSSYKWYGQRKIQICDEWNNNFHNFYTWAINNGYNDTLSIDHINVNDNYEPNNCRWTAVKIQANNKRSNKYITINNETKTLKQWCEQYNIKYKLVYTRINQLQWDPLKALTTPIKSKK